MTNATFQAIDPTTGSNFGSPITEMGKNEIEALINSAAAQKQSLAKTTPVERAALLRNIAASVEARREQLIEVTMKETALPNGRLTEDC